VQLISDTFIVCAVFSLSACVYVTACVSSTAYTIFSIAFSNIDVDLTIDSLSTSA
jgi:hypothetical protein